MPNKKAAIKALRQSKKRTLRNSLVKRNIKEIIKKGQKSVANGTIAKEAGTISKELQKAVDKAVRAGILKANTANRKKSRFAKMIKRADVKVSESPAKEENKKESK